MAPSAITTERNEIPVPKVDVHVSTGTALLHRDLHRDPSKVVSASGNYLTLSNGQVILDATGGAAVSCIGHGNQRVKSAIAAQLDETAYCHTLLFTSSGAEGLAKALIDSTHGEMAKAFIVSSGSEAMEAAMKLARQYYLEVSPPQPQRTRFIARNESYHGTTLGALSMSGHRARRAKFEPILLDNISRVSACNTYRGMRGSETAQDYVERLAQELDDEFQRVGPDTVCAFVAEPVVGAALGCVPSTPGYFKAMKAVCKKYGALLIMDEIMCGMGRCGTLHAWEYEGIAPDIQTIGKGLGGGYAPIAAILINHRVVDALDKGTGSFAHGQTYQGHPVSCAAALEVQNIIREGNLVENVRVIGDYLASSLRARIGNHPNVGDIRGRGLFLGIEFVKSKASREPFPPALKIANTIFTRAIDPKYSMTTYPGTGTADGYSGDHILLAPAYNVTHDVIDKIVETIGKVIEEVFQEISES
ncbi:hypothetical protein FGG08_003595 [Glutinoglossum americanum]|uniref:Aminotransferase n=1 Tax=Glutinoglossum americanum TaxID=1670608 RepID=A0A9P8I400_9PEZI|nr:hypothetical protein FGG08_003595 [Glutinoglossum americanum]